MLQVNLCQIGQFLIFPDDWYIPAVIPKGRKKRIGTLPSQGGCHFYPLERGLHSPAASAALINDVKALE